jgi:hypothetical protein
LCCTVTPSVYVKIYEVGSRAIELSCDPVRACLVGSGRVGSGRVWSGVGWLQRGPALDLCRPSRRPIYGSEIYWERMSSCADDMNNDYMQDIEVFTSFVSRFRCRVVPHCRVDIKSTRAVIAVYTARFHFALSFCSSGYTDVIRVQETKD